MLFYQILQHGLKRAQVFALGFISSHTDVGAVGKFRLKVPCRPIKFDPRRDWYGSFPLIRTVGDKIILHAGPSDSVSNEEELLKQAQDITLRQAYETKLQTGVRSQIVRDTVWDRDYLRTTMKLESEADRDPKVLRNPFITDKTIICGHTPLKEVFHSDRFHITCIDTASFAPAGHITVMDLDSGELYSS